MSRKKRATPIRQHYSKDLKHRVIYQAFTLKKTSTEIGIDLDMPLRVAQRIKKLVEKSERSSVIANTLAAPP
jgi:hypothetical protein